MKIRDVCIIQGLLLIFLVVLAAGCTNRVENSIDSGNNLSGPVEKVEVYHFHRTQQCDSCITLGEYAEDTVNAYFASQVQSGKVVFGHINVDLPENSALVRQYGPTGSSLWIGVYTSEGFSKEENLNVWYKLGDKDEYMTYLKEIIEKRLAGDFS